MSVAPLTTLPIVLVFSGLAYTDVATGLCAVCRSFRIYGLVAETLAWFDVGDGICKGPAFLAKLTTVLFLPAAGVAILRSKWLAEHQSKFSIRGSGFEGAPVQGRRHDANGSAVF